MRVDFKRIAKELYLEASFNLRRDIRKALVKAYSQEREKLVKEALSAILKNGDLAKKNRMAICQDTGYPVLFLKIGDIGIKNLNSITGDLTKGIREATIRGHLRYSVVVDPLDRMKIAPNIPPIFHIEFNNSKRLEIELLVKGFGSENQTKLSMLSPNTLDSDIVGIVADHIKVVGSKACPPYVIGIGIGGTADKAIILSKEAALISLDKKNKNKRLADLEQRIREEVNKLKIGPLGVGGETTCLGAKVLTHPTHIAGLPLGITVSCHAVRSAKKIIKFK
ncbi:MAG: fumarate hydratase [Candidatus Kaelpia aquatica]|nr:fumarate hydratase [Candidatus Kaelpia aquatica]